MRLIDADGLKEKCHWVIRSDGSRIWVCHDFDIDEAPTVDAVPVAHLEKWLYEIALNNTDNYLSDACEEIISRLDGLRRFSKEGFNETD